MTAAELSHHVRPTPGAVYDPVCGMTVRPRRFWVCVGLSVPLVALAMAEDFGNPALMAPRAAVWVQLVLATPAVLWGGWPFFERGWRSIVSRRLNMFTLIALGTGV